jgi:hypothetical protein
MPKKLANWKVVLIQGILVGLERPQLSASNYQGSLQYSTDFIIQYKARKDTKQINHTTVIAKGSRWVNFSAGSQISISKHEISGAKIGRANNKS